MFPSGDGSFGFLVHVLSCAGATWCFPPAGGILWCCKGLLEVSEPEGREGRRNHKKLKIREPRAPTTPPCPLQSPALRTASQRPSVHPFLRHHYSCHRNPSHKVRLSRASSTSRGWPLGSHTHHVAAGDLLPCLHSPPLPSGFSIVNLSMPSSLPPIQGAELSFLLSCLGQTWTWALHPAPVQAPPSLLSQSPPCCLMAPTSHFPSLSPGYFFSDYE